MTGKVNACRDCDGSGVTIDRSYIPAQWTNCKSCNGTGRVIKVERLEDQRTEITISIIDVNAPTIPISL